MSMDLDPQGNATSHLGFSPNDFERTINDVLIDPTSRFDINAVIIEHGTPGLFLIPANLSMSRADLSMSALIEKDHKLRKSIKRLKRNLRFRAHRLPPFAGHALGKRVFCG